eukprot:2496350-Rhodomonas_salina.1
MVSERAGRHLHNHQRKVFAAPQEGLVSISARLHKLSQNAVVCSTQAIRCRCAPGAVPSADIQATSAGLSCLVLVCPGGSSCNQTNLQTTGVHKRPITTRTPQA